METKLGLARTVSALCLVLFAASCIPIRANVPERSLPPQRIKQNGYSLVPPDERGWIVVSRDQFRLALVRKGDGPDETFAIQSTLVKLPTVTSTADLARYVQEGQTKDTDPQRFKVMVHDTVPQREKGIDCVTSHFVVEDMAAVKTTTRTGGMILEALVLTCPHPKNKSVGVSVTYSHRHYPEQKDTAFDQKAMRVLDSVEIDNP